MPALATCGWAVQFLGVLSEMKIRPAENDDIQTMARIIGHYASEGLMIPRYQGVLIQALSHYLVADHNGEIVGCGGLEPYSQNVAEIYGLATSPENSPRGTGSAIVKALIDRARRENLSQVFALTLAPGFFQKM